MDPEESGDNNTQEEIQKETQSTPSLGNKFKTAREEMGKSITEVANYLNLSAQVISDIESDDYSRVASNVYAKGYLRTYAKLLNLSDREILEEFSVTQLGSAIVEKQPQLISEKPPLINPKYQRWVTCGIMSIFFIGFIYWWSSGAEDNANSNALVLEEKKPEVKKVKEKSEEKIEQKIVEKKEEEKEKEFNIAVEGGESQPVHRLILSPEDVMNG